MSCVLINKLSFNEKRIKQKQEQEKKCVVLTKFLLKLRNIYPNLKFDNWLISNDAISPYQQGLLRVRCFTYFNKSYQFFVFLREQN